MASPTPEALSTGKIIRQSGLGSLRECGMKFAWGLRPDRPRRDGVVRAVGTAYHAGLEYVYAEIMQGSAVPPINDAVEAAIVAFDDTIKWATDGFDWVWQPETQYKRLEVLDHDSAIAKVEAAVIGMLATPGGIWNPHEYRPIAIEQSFQLPIEGYPEWSRTGTIDLILQRVSDGQIAIVDHKTAKRKWNAGKESHKGSPQAAFYLLAAQDLLGVDPYTTPMVYDIWVHDKGLDRRTTYRTPPQMGALVKEIESAIHVVESEAYHPNPSSNLCSPNYCDYWEVCPFGADAS